MFDAAVIPSEARDPLGAGDPSPSARLRMTAIDLSILIVTWNSERWIERLREEIASRDAFYLFWSLAASRSEWAVTSAVVERASPVLS